MPSTSRKLEVPLPRPPKGSKKRNHPKKASLLHWGSQGTTEGFHCLDPVGGLGLGRSLLAGVDNLEIVDNNCDYPPAMSTKYSCLG